MLGVIQTRQKKMEVNRKIGVLILIIVCLVFSVGCANVNDKKENKLPPRIPEDVNAEKENIPPPRIPEEERVNINKSENETILTRFSYFNSGWDYDQLFEIGVAENGDVIVSNLNYGIDKPLILVIPSQDFSFEFSIPLSRTEYDELIKIIDDFDLRSWDGFLDDELIGPDSGAFSLEIEWSDGSSVKAKGYALSPDNFVEAEEEIIRFFEQFEDIYFEKVQEYWDNIEQ